MKKVLGVSLVALVGIVGISYAASPQGQPFDAINTAVSAIQTQITNLQNQFDNHQSQDDARLRALESRTTALENQLKPSLCVDQNINSTTPSIILSGATLFHTDSSGNFSGSDRWNTLNSGDWSRAWIACGTPPDSLSSSIINGPTGNSSAISIPLRPGNYQFTLFLNDGTPIDFHGMNLFFDSDALPGISVFTQDTVALTDNHIFSADSQNTLALEPYTFDGTIIPGSGKLQYNKNGYTIQLTDFVFTSQFLYKIDRVNGLVTNPDGQFEKIVHFTLKVSSTTP